MPASMAAVASDGRNDFAEYIELAKPAKRIDLLSMLATVAAQMARCGFLHDKKTGFVFFDRSLAVRAIFYFFKTPCPWSSTHLYFPL